MAKYRNGTFSNKKRRNVPNQMSLRKHRVSGATKRQWIERVLEARAVNEAEAERLRAKQQRTDWAPDVETLMRERR